MLIDRKGISKFYDGKSKSFMCLANDVSSPSVKDIAKPENAYTRRRRNLMAFNHVWEKNRNFLLRSNNGGIFKRTLRLNQSAVAHEFAMKCSGSCSREESTSSSYHRSPPPRRRNQLSSASSSTNSSIHSHWLISNSAAIVMNSSMRNEAEHLSR